MLAFPIDEEPLESGRSPDSGGTGPGMPSEPEDIPVLLGDIVICPAVARRNAAEHAGTFEDELALLLVHGLLHLMGMEHVEEEEAQEMEAKERELAGPSLRGGPSRSLAGPARRGGAAVHRAGPATKPGGRGHVDGPHEGRPPWSQRRVVEQGERLPPSSGTDAALLVAVVVADRALGFVRPFGDGHHADFEE